MKPKMVITIVLSFILSAQLFAQEDIKLDTIFKLGQRKLIVEVNNISSATVRYKDPKTGESKTIARKKIQKIIFSNGRKEVFNKPVLMMIEVGDWKTVIVTDNKSDVQGLYALGKVKGRSSAGSKSKKNAKKSATIRMQKRTANIGGMIVLVTDSESIGGYGEPPSYRIEGIAYGFEKPKKKEEQK